MHLSSTTLRLVAATGAAAAAAAAVTALAGGPTLAAADSRHDRDNVQPRLDRAFVIMLENHSQHGVVGDPNAPFITSLAQKYGQATQYYGVTHPSEPNYVAAISGSNWWVNNDDAANRFDHTNIVDSLEGSRISWGAYMEAMPADDKLVDYWPGQVVKDGPTIALYASKHNPFVLFPSIRGSAARMTHVKPYTALAADLNRPDAPRYVFIAPDQCNDMHGGVYAAVAGHPETPCPYGSATDDPNDAALKQKADAFVRQAVTTIMHSRAWTPYSAIFIVADEGDYTANTTNAGWDSPAGCCDSPVLPAGTVSPAWPGGVYGGGLVPAVVVTGRGPRHVVSDVAYNHYSLLRTIEDAWGLPELGYTSDHVQVHTMNALLGG